VLRLSQHDDPRPERASLLRPAGQPAPVTPTLPARKVSQRSPAGRPQPPVTQRPRPAWLLPEPLPLAAQAGRPLQEGSALPLRLLTRAERIESGWFDDALVRRDYYVALGQDGLLRWVYCERPASTLVPTGPGAAPGLPASGSPRWFLHGLFA
jgi:protein ImuB